MQLTVSLAFVYVLYARFHVQSKEEVALYRLMEHYAWFSKVGRRKAAAILTAVFVLCEEDIWDSWQRGMMFLWIRSLRIWGLRLTEAGPEWRRKIP